MQSVIVVDQSNSTGVTVVTQGTTSKSVIVK